MPCAICPTINRMASLYRHYHHQAKNQRKNSKYISLSLVQTGIRYFSFTQQYEIGYRLCTARQTSLEIKNNFSLLPVAPKKWNNVQCYKMLPSSPDMRKQALNFHKTITIIIKGHMYCGMVLEVPHSNDFGYSNTMHKSEACRFTLLDLGQVNLNFFALFLTSNGASQYSVIGQMQ